MSGNKETQCPSKFLRAQVLPSQHPHPQLANSETILHGTLSRLCTVHTQSIKSVSMNLTTALGNIPVTLPHAKEKVLLFQNPYSFRTF